MHTRSLSRSITITVVVVAVALGGYLIARGGAADDALSVGTQGAGQLAAPGAALLCGPELPLRLMVPDGYAAPVEGASPDAVGSARPGQLVLHWRSSTGSIEARWPADANRQLSSPKPGQSLSGAVSQQPKAAAGGRVTREMLYSLPDESRADCQTLQINVFDLDPSRLSTVVDQIVRQPFESDVPLVASSQRVDRAPGVAPCRTRGNAAIPPNRHGAADAAAGSFPTAVEALQALLAAQTTLLPRGYVEMALPDGSVVYGHHGGPGRSDFVTVVRVSRSDRGWSVQEWEASGC